MTAVLRVFAFEHNRVEAAAQDYDLARIEYRAICENFDATDERSVGRFQAALERKNEARERFWHHKFAN